MTCHVFNPFDKDINLTTIKGHKLFRDRIKPLEEKYDGSTEKAMYLQTKVINESESRCWAMISQIIVYCKDINILKQPGKLTFDDLMEYVQMVWTDGDINDNDVYQKRICHNMMGMILIESIMPALRQ